MDIKGTIKRHGFTLERVARELGVSKGSFSITANGNPTISTLRRIASVIGCPMSEFFADEATESPNAFVCPKCGARLKVVEDNATE